MQAAEDKLVARIATAFASKRLSHLTLGIGDDGALLTPRAGFQTILTCDWFLEGTHFLPHKHPPDSIGWKALARAVSDLAAMGGLPKSFLLSLALPKRLTEAPKGLAWLDDFLAGMSRAARRFDCTLAGGDTTRRRDVLINITVVGEIPAGRAILRSGARKGDLIYVSGRLGEAALGLQLLRKLPARASKRLPFLRKHLYPEPRLALAQWLAKKQLATSMIDLSDGLSSDLGRLCAASGVGALLDSDQFPVARVPASLRRRVGDPLHAALHGGDDYELLFTARPGKLPTLPFRSPDGLLIHPIGVVTSGPNVVFHRPSPHESIILRPGGWDPFRT
jgi:thiamine-monophosphate kinase